MNTRWQSLVAALSIASVLATLAPLGAAGASTVQTGPSAGVGPHPPAAPDTDYRTTVKNDDPLTYWRLGESSGPTAVDIGRITDHSLDGAYSATGVSYGQPGALVGDAATSIALNGSSGKVDVPNTTGNPLQVPNVTVEGWVKPAGAAQSTVIFRSPGVGNETGYILHLWSNGKFRMYIDKARSQWVYAESTTSVPSDK